MGRITKDIFGETRRGEQVERYTLSNKNGYQIQVITYGGAITSLKVPTKSGSYVDIVTGYDTIKEYEENPPYFGVILGRVANRIRGGSFSLDGETYKLALNNGPNHLHGGPAGFGRRNWVGVVEEGRLKLMYVSADGEEGYPGELSVTVTYELTDDNEIVLDCMATTSRATPVNLSNHSYFNLAGHTSKNIYDHMITIYAEKFTPKDKDDVPTGEIASVANTEFDLRAPVLIGERINKVPLLGNQRPGFDHNYCLGKDNEKKLAARVEHEESGHVLECYTTQPGVQFYTANYVENVHGKDGAIYGQHCALCLETQNYPDSINKVRPAKKKLT